MNSLAVRTLRGGTLLAINLLFLMIWAFAGIDKLWNGMPSWFGEKFGPTLLGSFPGVSASFWLLTFAEVVGLGFAFIALLRAEFWGKRPPVWLSATLVWSLFVFLQLGFGQWLTKEFNGAFQQFAYFCGTLVATVIVNPRVLRTTPTAP